MVVGKIFHLKIKRKPITWLQYLGYLRDPVAFFISAHLIPVVFSEMLKRPLLREYLSTTYILLHLIPQDAPTNSVLLH